MEANIDELRALSLAVTRLVGDASRGLARSLDLNRVMLLRLAVDTPGISPGEAARRTGLPPSSVTRHVQALEDAGQVVLRRNSDDRRGAAIAATPAGAAELAAIDAVGAEIFAGVLRGWSAEDVVTLTGLLRRLTQDWATRGDQVKQRRRRVSRWQLDEEEQG